MALRDGLEAELRAILNNKDGIAMLDYVEPAPRHLVEALTSRGYLHHDTTLRKAAEIGLEAEIRASDSGIETTMQDALLIQLGIDPRGHGKTAAGRRDEAIKVSRYSEDVYRHDRGPTKQGTSARPGRLTVAVRQLVVRLANTSEPGPAGATVGRTHAEELDAAWRLLDQCRTNGAIRKQRLEELLRVASELAEAAAHDEARALVEFARYEENRLESYRLRQGVALLEAGIDAYEASETSPTGVFDLRLYLMDHQMAVALVGDQTHAQELESLTHLIAYARASLARAPETPLSRAQCLVALAEALKEKGMITHDFAENVTLRTEAQERCEEALRLLDAGDLDSLRVLAKAHRHVAITYEMEADKTADGDHRRRAFEDWLRHSEDAAELARKAGDDFVQGYALLNAASAHTRLAEVDAMMSRRREHLSEGVEQLRRALALHEAIDELRGQAWSHIHLCENTEARAAQAQANDDEYRALLQEFETYANRSVAFIGRLEDKLGRALTHLQLGKALYLLHRASDADSAASARFAKVITEFTHALDLCARIGYVREALAAARWLARCYHEAWKDAPDNALLLRKALEAQTLGLFEVYVGHNDIPALESLYRELDGRAYAQLY